VFDKVIGIAVTIARSSMDNRIVYRRTPKGEHEVSLRTLPHSPWLTLVMVDGRATVGDLMAMNPELPEVALSLDRLRREGFIEPLHAGAMPNLPTETTEPDPLPMAWVHGDEPLRTHDRAAIAAWVRRGMLLLPVVLLGVMAFLGYRSLDDLRARMEATLGKRASGYSSADVSYTFAPWPALKFSNVAIGKAFNAEELVVHPSLAALMGTPGSIAHLELRFAKLSGPEMLAMLVGPSAHPEEPEPLAARVTLSASKLELGPLTLAPLTAEMRYGSDGKLESAVLGLEDGRARAIVKRKEGELAIEFSSSNWSTPTNPVMTFGRLDASGKLDGERIVLSRVEGLLNDGLIKGDLTLGWWPSLVAQGRFSATNLDLQSLIAHFTPDFSVGGRLDAEGDFSARASSLEGLLYDANVDATFRVKRGVVHNADIVSAARDGATGGSTQFEELSGSLQTAGRAFSFRQIELGSGLVTAKGALDITPSRQMVGRFTVTPKAHGQVGGTVVVGGSLKEPTLRPGG